MEFVGLSKVFSTLQEGQYEAIGAFWDAMSAQFGRENLRGLGYNWTENTITYVIGLKEGFLPPDAAYPGASYESIRLPDSGWLTVTGRTEDLPRLYARIYADGPLAFEIEQFFCKRRLRSFRNQKIKNLTCEKQVR